MSKLSTYKSYSTLEEAKAFALWLRQNDIPSKIEDNTPQLSSIFIGDTLQDNYFLKIRDTDFQIVNKLYSEKVQEDVKNLHEEYYLYSFTNEELLEILDNPDDWDEFNIQASLQILNERGLKMDPNIIEDIHFDQLIEESKPEKLDQVWIILGYGLAILGGFLAIVIGNYIHTSKKTLRDGNVIHRYVEEDRSHGLIISIVGFVFFFFALGYRLWLKIQEGL